VAEGRCRRLSSWETTEDGALALVIVLDQFPRNMFRNDIRAYSSDGLARAVADRAIARGADMGVEPGLLEFLYMPLMHSEQLADQQRCVELFRKAGNTDNLQYAERHAEIIRRFGRFRAIGKRMAWAFDDVCEQASEMRRIRGRPAERSRAPGHAICVRGISARTGG